MKIAVVGDGGWGSTLAIYLLGRGNAVSMWSHDADYVEVLKKKRENPKFLPGVAIPKELDIRADAGAVLKDADWAILAVPSAHMRGVCRKIKPHVAAQRWVSVAKGIEQGVPKRMSEVIQEELGVQELAVLSGPTHAEEVSRGMPTSAVIGAKSAKMAADLQGLLNSERFRLYTSEDVAGVELGGSLKNVIAIAVGISDGMGFGDNTKAALMTRGLEEIMRLGVACGAKRETFAGLSGMGDLVTTCISRHSRNRTFGEAIGRGMKVQDALAGTEMVVEGVHTVQSACALAKDRGAEVPVMDQVRAVVHEAKDPKQAVRDLLQREPGHEIRR